MFVPRLSLKGNIALLAAVISVPYIALWVRLLETGRIDGLMIGTVGLLLVLDSIVLFLFLRGLVRPLRLVSTILDQVAAGDLTRNMEHSYRGEFGAMLDDVNRSVAASRQLVGNMLDATVNVASASFETITASARVVYNVDDEAKQVQAISEASGRISASIAGIAESATEADAAARSSRATVSRSQTVVQETISQMAELARAAQASEKRVESLSDSSRHVGEISRVIGEIAAQTNLLALNAAIEAARAGEHGRGFAVVADEVRALAERTTKATTEISDRVQVIQQEIAAVIATMHASMAKVEEAKEASARTRASFEEVCDGIDTLTGLIGRIAQATEEQNAATREIADGIGAIAALSNANTRHAHRAVDIVAAMDESVAVQLRSFDRFQVPDKALVLAKSDHVMWKKRLTEMLLGRVQIEPKDVVDHHACRFGRWYDNEGRVEYGHLAAFAPIERPHQQVHETARQVVELCAAGEKAQAQQLLEQLSVPTRAVLEALDGLRLARQQERLGMNRQAVPEAVGGEPLSERV